jgi:RNA polymerase sigma-70 factor (ECF subfamily)
MQAPHDEEIIRLCAHDSTRDKGFALLLKCYSARLYQVLFGILRHHQDTDDALQNAFVKAYRYLPQFEQRSSLYTWLHRIAIHAGLDMLEQRKRHRRLVMTDQLPDTETSGQVFDSQRAVALLEEAVAQLPPKQGVVFRLRYYEELPYEHISEMLGTSVGALKANFHHALRFVEQYISQRV